MVDAASEGVQSDPSTTPEEQTMATGNRRISNFFGKLEELGITLDVVENPLNVVQLFLGQDIDLVTWDAPELDLGFSIERSFPVFAGIKGLLRGDFNVYSDLVFGFDTFGFSQWKETDFNIEDAYLVFDGFYLSDIDPETGEDIDELTLDATIAAGVSASVVIASVEAVGGVTGTAGLDLVDVGEYTGESDGRIRASEITSRINRPAQLFEIAGAVEAFLEIAVKIGIDLGFWSIQKTVYERELARVTLFEFSIGGGGGGSFANSTQIVEQSEPQTPTSSYALLSSDTQEFAPAAAVEPTVSTAAVPVTDNASQAANDLTAASIVQQPSFATPRYVALSTDRSVGAEVHRTGYQTTIREARDLIYADLDADFARAARTDEELTDTDLMPSDTEEALSDADQAFAELEEEYHPSKEKTHRLAQSAV